MRSIETGESTALHAQPNSVAVSLLTNPVHAGRPSSQWPNGCSASTPPVSASCSPAAIDDAVPYCATRGALRDESAGSHGRWRSQLSTDRPTHWLPMGIVGLIREVRSTCQLFVGPTGKEKEM